jgi:hypothetical protein
MIRRAFIQIMTGISTGAAMPKINKPNRAVTHSTGPVEGGVEPMPSFPVLIVMKDEDIKRRSILLMVSENDMKSFDPDLTDDKIKDLYYRNASFFAHDSMGVYRAYRMSPYGKVVTNLDGTVSWWAPKGLSGEDMTVTF